MSATAQQIPKERWQAYFLAVASECQGWSTTVEVLQGELGDQRQIDGLPLQGISYESKGGSQAGDILVEAGDIGEPFDTHLIHRPRAVRAAITQPGQELDLEIEDSEGIVNIVRLRPRPELPPPKRRA